MSTTKCALAAKTKAYCFYVVNCVSSKTWIMHKRNALTTTNLKCSQQALTAYAHPFLASWSWFLLARYMVRPGLALHTDNDWLHPERPLFVSRVR